MKRPRQGKGMKRPRRVGNTAIGDACEVLADHMLGSPNLSRYHNSVQEVCIVVARDAEEAKALSDFYEQRIAKESP